MTGLPTNSYADLLADLTYLRKAGGLTLGRLARTPAVVRLCGGDDLPTDTELQRLVTAVRSLGNIPQGAALAAAYGINHPEPGEGVSLDARRGAYAKAAGRKPYTVREWEDTAIRELALRLLSRYYAGADTGNVVLPHGGFLITRLSVTTVIKNRAFEQSGQHRTLLSLVDGAKGFQYGTYSETVLDDVAGATLQGSQRHPGGSVHTLIFPQPLRRGQMHTFSFRERVAERAVDGSADADSGFSGQTFETPALEYQVAVQFDGPAPAAVWAYDKLSRIERPGRLTRANQLYPTTNSVAASFTELYGGLCAGVAWLWEHAEDQLEAPG